MDGWIKTYRSMLDNPVVNKDNDYFKVWMWLLLKANHGYTRTNFKGEKLELTPGQLVAGRKVIADECNCSESKAQRILKDFAEDGQIIQETSNRARLITINNWSIYQNGLVAPREPQKETVERYEEQTKESIHRKNVDTVRRWMQSRFN